MKSRLKILHVEDSAVDAELARSLLEEDGFACDVVVTGDKASFEEALTKGPFDLILSDFNLPDLDGRTALTLAQQELPNVPFILLSGSIGEEQAVECLKG